MTRGAAGVELRPFLELSSSSTSTHELVPCPSTLKPYHHQHSVMSQRPSALPLALQDTSSLARFAADVLLLPGLAFLARTQRYQIRSSPCCPPVSSTSDLDLSRSWERLHVCPFPSWWDTPSAVALHDGLQNRADLILLSLPCLSTTEEHISPTSAS